MLAITSSRFNESLFNIDEDAFNKKIITKILRVKLHFLEYNDYYASYLFRRDATIKTRNSNVLEAMIMLLGRWKSNIYLRYIEINPNLILQASRRH
jgi:hypothetical protein